jgi:outer membrane protein assembly factor BamB
MSQETFAMWYPFRRLTTAAFALKLLAFTAALFFVPYDSLGAAEPLGWPQFRGLHGLGVATGGVLPDQWTENDYRWTIDLPGMGIGSFAVHQNHVYLVNAEPDKNSRSVLALDLTSGKIVWQLAFPLSPHPLHARNTFASSTPVVDDRAVYFAWADPEQISVMAISHDGKVLWKRTLGRWQSEHGFATSPTLLDGRLFLLNSQQGEQLDPGQQAGQSSMLSLDPSTGNTIWESPLTTKRVCYGVPALRIASDGSQQVVAATDGDGLFGLDFATGKMLWQNRVFTARCVSCPLVMGDLVIGSAGSGNGGNHLVAVRPPDSHADAQGVMEAPEVYRMKKFAPYVPTSAVVGKRLLMIDDKGIASSVDGMSGDLEWSERIGGNYSASPIVVGEKMLVIDLDGQAHVLGTGERLEVLGKIDLGGPVQATPAYAQGCLLLRIGNRVCCLGGKSV